MAGARILAVIGNKNHGKTTLAIALAAEYARKGRRVLTVKDARQPVTADRPGSDSHRLFHEGKSARTLLVGPGVHARFDHPEEGDDILTLARRHGDGMDLVLVEGVEVPGVPRIEVFRTAAGPKSVYGSAKDRDEWVAIITDDERLQAACPVLRFRDTMWLQLLANLGWEKARAL